MTRKDYELIAAAVKVAHTRTAYWYEGTNSSIEYDVINETINSVVFALSEALKTDNAAFDRVKFEAACRQ